jgi:hypothetical protein
MSEEITLADSITTAEANFFESIKVIDGHLGKGYAAKHPVLIGAFMQAVATDYAASWICQNLANINRGVQEIA